MRATLKVHLIKALEESKQAKKDKWIKENAGQCVIRLVLCAVNLAARYVLRVLVRAVYTLSVSSYGPAVQGRLNGQLSVRRL